MSNLIVNQLPLSGIIVQVMLFSFRFFSKYIPGLRMI